ncbi:MAG: hypothetical protein N3D74_04165 [Caldisericia bacterium]|nr:hypothetical protein [Caldisericia bacterium]
MNEMFHEGWYKPFEWIYFLLPSIITILLSIISILYPKIGGVLIIIFGGIFSITVLSRIISINTLSLKIIISWIPVTFLFILMGFLFIYESKKKQISKKIKLKRVLYLILINLIIIFLFGVPLFIRNINRFNDGYRGERKIKGFEIELIWSGEGVAFHFKSKGNLSWNEIALYGKGEIGFEGKKFIYATKKDFEKYNMFRYINYEGTELTDKIYDFWRLPTIDELTRSMYRKGKCVGVPWNGKEGKQNYEITPDKETPLWLTNEPVIYYLSSTEANDKEIYTISYNGCVIKRDKSFVIGSLGFRAVRTNKSFEESK